MSKPTLSKALSIISDLKDRFAFYHIGEPCESATVPGALVVNSEILNALKVIVDVAEASENYIHLLQFGGDTQQALTNIFAQSGETMAAKKRNPDVGLDVGMRPRVEACTKKRPGTFGHLEALCDGKRIVCEKRGKKISLTSPDGGTTADCESLAEAYDVYRTDPAFRDLPLILGGRVETILNKLAK